MYLNTGHQNSPMPRLQAQNSLRRQRILTTTRQIQPRSLFCVTRQRHPENSLAQSFPLLVPAALQDGLSIAKPITLDPWNDRWASLRSTRPTLEPLTLTPARTSAPVAHPRWP